MNTNFKLLFLLLSSALLIVSCKSKEETAQPSAASYVVADSLKAWCRNSLPENRISYEGSTIKLMFYEEDLNTLWKPAYSEASVKELADKEHFGWRELPVHEGNRRWEMLLDLQPEDSTYPTPNNLLLYLFR